MAPPILQEKTARRRFRDGARPIVADAGYFCPDRPRRPISSEAERCRHMDHTVRLEHVLDRHPGGVALAVPDRQRLALELEGELFAGNGLILILPLAWWRRPTGP